MLSVDSSSCLRITPYSSVCFIKANIIYFNCNLVLNYFSAYAIGQTIHDGKYSLSVENINSRTSQKSYRYLKSLNGLSTVLYRFSQSRNSHFVPVRVLGLMFAPDDVSASKVFGLLCNLSWIGDPLQKGTSSMDGLLHFIAWVKGFIMYWFIFIISFHLYHSIYYKLFSLST